MLQILTVFAENQRILIKSSFCFAQLVLQKQEISYEQKINYNSQQFNNTVQNQSLTAKSIQSVLSSQRRLELDQYIKDQRLKQIKRSRRTTDVTKT